MSAFSEVKMNSGYYGWRYPEEAEIQQIEQRIMETQK